MEIGAEHASNSPVMFVTFNPFAVLLFLSTCCVNSLPKDLFISVQPSLREKLRAFFRSGREQDEKAKFFHCIPFYALCLVRRSPLFHSRKFTAQSPVFPLDRRDQTLTVTCGHLGFSLPRSEAPRLIVEG